MRFMSCSTFVEVFIGFFYAPWLVWVWAHVVTKINENGLFQSTSPLWLYLGLTMIFASYNRNMIGNLRQDEYQLRLTTSILTNYWTSNFFVCFYGLFFLPVVGLRAGIPNPSPEQNVMNLLYRRSMASSHSPLVPMAQTGMIICEIMILVGMNLIFVVYVLEEGWFSWSMFSLHCVIIYAMKELLFWLLTSSQRAGLAFHNKVLLRYLYYVSKAMLAIAVPFEPIATILYRLYKLNISAGWSAANEAMVYEYTYPGFQHV